MYYVFNNACIKSFTSHDLYTRPIVNWVTMVCHLKKNKKSPEKGLGNSVLKDWMVKVMSPLSLPGSGCLRASRPAWSRSGWRSGGCPSDRGPASLTSASSPSRATLASCVRGWWRTWTPTTATTPLSSSAWSSTACKDGVEERNGVF